MSDDRHVRLSFPSKPEYLLLARLALSGIARHLPLDDTTLADLKLAVTEACGNAVRHAYLEGAGPVRLSFVVAADRLQMIVEDQGVGLDAASPRTATVQPLEGGMGMAIIRAIVDELDVQTGEDGRGTVVRMTKYLTGPAATS